MKEKMKDIMLSSAFLIWFMGSIILMFMYKEDIPIILIIFGQVFLILGGIFTIGFIVEKKLEQNLMVLIFPIVGIGCMISGLLIKFVDKNYFENGKWAYLIAIIFIIYGIFDIIGYRIKINYLKKNCTKIVVGKIVDLQCINSYKKRKRRYLST